MALACQRDSYLQTVMRPFGIVIMWSEVGRPNLVYYFTYWFILILPALMIVNVR